MASTLLQNIMEFASSITALAAQKRQSRKARQLVCERSRYLKFSVTQVDRNGRGRLHPSLARWIDALFRQALDMLAAREDAYLRNVRARYDGEIGIKPILERAMTSRGKSRTHRGQRGPKTGRELAGSGAGGARSRPPT